jgi:hypothetical protein
LIYLENNKLFVYIIYELSIRLFTLQQTRK